MATRSGSLVRRVTRNRSTGAWIISGVGVSLAGLTIWYLLVFKAFHLQAAWNAGTYAFLMEVIELALLAGFSIVLMYAGYWLGSSRFDDRRVWLAGLWTLIGFAGIVTILTFAHSLQIAQGHQLPEPSVVQIMLLVAGAGALAGLLIGVSTIKETAEAERARRQRDTIVFVNQLLRHNVLNGMQIITGNAEILKDHVDEEGQCYLHQTQERADTIVDLVQNVRALTESLSLEIETQPIDLNSLLHETIDSTEKVHPHADIRFDPDDDIVVLADDLLEPVFDNLLANAIVHNDRETPVVDVDVAVEGPNARIEIADNGPGIPADDRERYFEPGEQDDGRIGQGIGLYLVKTLVERYDGSVHVTDNEPRGARFVVLLPRADHVAPSRIRQRVRAARDRL